MHCTNSLFNGSFIHMKRYILHEPFNIYHFEADRWQHPVHNHTYYEIIFILKGSGRHLINDYNFTYKSGDVFLLGPEDYHLFDIDLCTEFCYIRFMEDFNKYSAQERDTSWQQTVKLLLQTPFQSKGSIVQSENEKNSLHQLLAVLEGEYNNFPKAGFEIMRDSLMKAIMIILSRNLLLQTLPKSRTNPVSSHEDIIAYINDFHR